jgi:hypothetical protein
MLRAKSRYFIHQFKFFEYAQGHQGHNICPFGGCSQNSTKWSTELLLVLNFYSRNFSDIASENIYAYLLSVFQTAGYA